MSKMMSVPADELNAILWQGEYLFGCVAADGFHASEHILSPSKPHVAITEQRIVLFSRRGIRGKRLDEEMSWPLTIFTDFINFNEGTALEPFLYFVTLFTVDNEAVWTAFKSHRAREAFKDMVDAAFGPVL